METCKNKFNIEALITNPADYYCYAVGDRSRYEANKEILTQHISYLPAKDLENLRINNDGKTIIIFTGKVDEELKLKVINNGYQTISMFEIINYKATQFWNNKKEYIGVDLNHYCSNPVIVSYSQEVNKNIMSLEKCFETYLKDKKDLTCLSVGCGCGALERKLLERGCFKRIDGCDISYDSIKQATNKANEIDKENIINYFVADLNKDELKVREYDLVIACSCMHHIENLEFAYENINNSLKDEGIFYQSEYTNADRFQFGYRLIKTVNKILKILPKKWEKQNEYVKPRLIDMLNSDASEAVRSSEIIPLTSNYFDILSLDNALCAIMHILYQCIDTRYFHSENGKPILNKLRTIFLCKLVYGAEKILTKRKKIGFDTAIIIARKKSYENSKA